MFGCTSCVLRTLRAVAGDSLHFSHPDRLPLVLTPHLSPYATHRRASTATAIQPAEGTEGHLPLKISKKIPKPVVAQRHLEIELSYLNDRVKLASYVKDLVVQNNDVEKALGLVRLASKDRSPGGCIVAWNHIIDYVVQQGQWANALDIYNDMKKRGQSPDSHTYVTLLRGFSSKQTWNEDVSSKQVVRAMSVYNSLYAPNSKVEPSIMHANAALHVCARAQDMDALWSIVGRLPESGPGAPDVLTYTILLQALKREALSPGPDLSQTESDRVKLEAVSQARKLWMNVTRQWRSGELKVDEFLVVSVAKVLLLSPRMRDWDDVLSLMEQTMNIWRALDRLGSVRRNVQHVPEDKYAQDTKAAESRDAKTAIEEREEEGDIPTEKVFLPLTPLKSSGPQSRSRQNYDTFQYAKPGPNTLSVLVRACHRMRAPQAIIKYWKQLTSEPYNVQPDLPSFNSLLVAFAANRSSARAAGVLTHELPSRNITPTSTTIRHAMLACVRDKNNPKSLEHADAVIDAMEKHIADPDTLVLTDYITLALGTNDEAKIVRAIDRLDPIIHNLRSMVVYGPNRYTDPGVWRQSIKDASQFFQVMVGAIDTLMNRNLVPRSSFQSWHARRKDLTEFIGRLKKRSESVDSWRPRSRQQPDSDGDEVSDEVSESPKVHAKTRKTWDRRHASKNQADALRRFRHAGSGVTLRKFAAAGPQWKWENTPQP